ncbi:MAG: 5-(carboxyamino)imidazole ribonucleotide synthase [Coleofasciculaceae cyanobacterium SM2_1_6]|nr:5-(carboxyamino)imidazole ribonucleotide synthase [Coleofasciculaceae cyanobacterium SM2_1_6]
MMGEPAQKLGLELIIQTPHLEDPAVGIAKAVVYAEVGDAIATSRLAAQCDVIGFENEFVDLPNLKLIPHQENLFRPSLQSLEPLLDKYNQRCYLQELELPNPQFWLLENPNQDNYNFSYPLVLKARRHGYDGQGTIVVKNQAELITAWQSMSSGSILGSVLGEEFIPFTKELSIIAARATTGEIRIYPIFETQQEDQVCRRVFAPAAVSQEVVLLAEKIITTILESTKVVGLFAVELFLTETGKLLVNEIAPRTHNSGHLTIDACPTSQFEQYLRAIAEQPLGEVNLQTAGAVMVNLLGYAGLDQDNYLDKKQLLEQIPHSHFYWYGKNLRPGRKLGHITILIPEVNSQGMQEQMRAIAHQVESIWYS